MSRAVQEKLGNESCERVKKELSRYGEVDPEEFQNSRNGSYGNPDVVFRQGGKLYGIEVKRCKGVAFKKGVGNISLTFRQWRGLTAWCKKFGAKPLLIVEIVVIGGENICFVVGGKVVSEKFKNRKGNERFTFTMWQVIRMGHKLEGLFSE